MFTRLTQKRRLLYARSRQADDKEVRDGEPGIDSRGKSRDAGAHPRAEGEREIDQWREVFAFKDQIRAEALCWDYSGNEEFKSLVSRHLCQLLIQEYGAG
jgi:hypothetical protein